MMWEEHKKKQVKIVQRDGWVKTGIYLGCVDDFIQLQYNDGRIVSIAVDQIVILEPRGDR